MNRLSRNVFFIVLLFSFAGCSWLSAKDKSFIKDFERREIKKPLQFSRAVEAPLLETGKSILIVPFLAGENVVASEELKAASLMFIRGVYDEFQDKKARFELMSKENMEKSDFLVEGHVVNWFEPKWFSRIFLRNKDKLLGVEGKMTDLNTGRVILSFEDEIACKGKNISYRDLAHILGVRFGKFILSQDIKKK
jgi:hypothetical protein